MGKNDELAIANDPQETVSKESEDAQAEESIVEESSSEVSVETVETVETEAEEPAAEEEEEEEDLVDPQDTLKEECTEKPACVQLKEVLDACNERVESRTNTEETCSQELYDFMHCVDHCVSKTLWSKIK